MNEALRSALKKLRLSGLLESLEVRLQEAVGNSLSHAEFLELIVQDDGRGLAGGFFDPHERRNKKKEIVRAFGPCGIKDPIAVPAESPGRLSD